jgi:hypothetical protein
LKHKRSPENYSKKNGSKLDHSIYQDNGPEKALEKLETKLANCEVTHQAIWSIAKSLTTLVDQRHHLQFMVLRPHMSSKR